MDQSTTYYIIAFVILFILIALALYIRHIRYRKTKIYNNRYPIKRIDWSSYKSSRSLDLS